MPEPEDGDDEAEEDADDEANDDAEDDEADMSGPMQVDDGSEAPDLATYARELHAEYRKPRVYRRYFTPGRDNTWEADLCFMDADKAVIRMNQRYRYIALWQDQFTRYLWATPVKNKEAATLLQTFEAAVEANGGVAPRYIHADRGSEYTGATFSRAVKERYGTIVYHTNSDVGAAIVENVIRFLRHRFAIAQTERLQADWLAVLPDVVEAWNQHHHSVLGMTPAQAQALDDAGQQALFVHLYGQPRRVPKQAKRFAVGDKVRLATSSGIFAKRSRDTRWSAEVFTIADIDKGQPWLYSLIDPEDNEPMTGRFYASELQLAAPSAQPIALINSVEDEVRRGPSGVVERKVRYYGHRGARWVKQDTLDLKRFGKKPLKA